MSKLPAAKPTVNPQAPRRSDLFHLTKAMARHNRNRWLPDHSSEIRIETSRYRELDKGANMSDTAAIKAQLDGLQGLSPARDEIAKGHRRQDKSSKALTGVNRGRPRAARKRCRDWARRCWCGRRRRVAPGLLRQFTPDLAARRPDRHQHRSDVAGRAKFEFQRGRFYNVLLADDQPRDAENAVGTARSHAGAQRHGAGQAHRCPSRFRAGNQNPLEWRAIRSRALDRFFFNCWSNTKVDEVETILDRTTESIKPTAARLDGAHHRARSVGGSRSPTRSGVTASPS